MAAVGETPKSSWELMSQKKPPEVKKEEEEKKVVFKRLIPEMTTKKLKVGVHGLQKTGKTRFALSASVHHGPLYIIATEPGLFPLARLFPEGEIYFAENSAGEPTVYELDETDTFELEATKTLKNIDNAVREIRKKCLADPTKVGTVVVDSVSDVWSWVQSWMKLDLLKLDKTARVRQHWDWQYANDKYQNIIMQLISLPAHVILTAQDREEYTGAGQPAGTYEARWQNRTPFLVDIIIGMHKVKKLGKILYFGEIEDARHMDLALNPIVGEVIENLDFDKLVALVNRKPEVNQTK